VADRVAVLRSRLVASDTPAALRARLFGSRVRVTLATDAAPFAAVLQRAGGGDVRTAGNTLSIAVDDAAARAPAIVSTLVAAGAAIQSVAPEEPPLEEVYLRLLAGSPS
jgi:ABC-2 type transport system ATP-binding protein